MLTCVLTCLNANERHQNDTAGYLSTLRRVHVFVNFKYHIQGDIAIASGRLYQGC